MTRLSALRAAHLALLAPLALALTHCQPNRRESESSFRRDETVYVGGRQWGEPSSFNPLLGWQDWPVNAMNLVYETLFLFNPLTGKLEPLLGESYQVNEDSVEVVLQEKARWSDGKPVTGHDVKYTFELGQKYKSVPVASFWSYITEVQLPEEGSLPAGKHPRRVVFKLHPDHENPLVVLDQLQGQRILPKHVIEPLLAQSKNDINEFNKLKFNDRPVGSGPFPLHSYSSEKIVTVRDDNYWGNDVFFGGKKAAPKYVIHPIYKSNSHFSVALQQGRLDASSAFMPRIWLKKKKGVHSWYDKEPFFPPGCIPMLYVNVLRKPLNDRQMRRAMAYAINYKDIRELAVSGYSQPLKPGIILPFGLEARYYSEEDAQAHGASVYDPEKAKATLKAAGYQSVFAENGQLIETRDAKGNKVPTVFITSPTGWSDWESIVRIAVRSLRSAGIDARERFIDASVYWGALNNGEFDLVMNTPSSDPSPSKPWSRFEFLLNSQDWKPEGEKMYKNFGRFNDPKGSDYVPRIDELLKLIPQLKDEAALTKAYRELNVLFMQLQPTLPLVYRPDQFYQYSDQKWQGFPNAENPFLPGQIPGDRLGTRILWHLKPTG